MSYIALLAVRCLYSLFRAYTISMYN